jgi:hypothetical protein
MGYLGLDESPVKDDNLFQRLFWPSDNASDTDALGVQGFWICMIAATLSFVELLVSGNWIVALLALAFFALGGMGVREHNVAAAILVAVAYLVGVIGNLIVGLPPGVLSLIATVMLFTNIRATHIANRWSKLGDPAVMPDRRTETFIDKFVDQMPARVWPPMQVPFFCIAALYLILSILGTSMLGYRIAHPAAVSQPMQMTLPGEK